MRLVGIFLFFCGTGSHETDGAWSVYHASDFRVEQLSYLLQPLSANKLLYDSDGCLLFQEIDGELVLFDAVLLWLDKLLQLSDLELFLLIEAKLLNQGWIGEIDLILERYQLILHFSDLHVLLVQLHKLLIRNPISYKGVSCMQRRNASQNSCATRCVCWFIFM